MILAEASASFHVWSLKALLHWAVPAGAVNMSRRVTFGPFGVSHGKRDIDQWEARHVLA